MLKSLKRAGPWITPIVVITEVVLIFTGTLDVGRAIALLGVVELLLAVVVGSRVFLAWRALRSARADGRSRWQAAEEALGQVVPRPVARVLLTEGKFWWCAANWIFSGKSLRPGEFSYYRSIQPLLITIGCLLLLEGAVVEVVVATIGSEVWLWILLGLHVYALIWLVGWIGSLHVLPHQVGDESLIIRDSVFNDVTVEYRGIKSVAVSKTTRVGRSGLKIDATGAGVIGNGDTTVKLILDPAVPVKINGVPSERKMVSITLTVDEPEAFRELVSSRVTA